MSSLSPFAAPVPAGSPTPEDQQIVLGHLTVRYLDGQIDGDAFDELVSMLGLSGDETPRTGHLKGGRRAMQHRAQGRGAPAC